jgi:putative transcriptional regulator
MPPPPTGTDNGRRFRAGRESYLRDLVETSIGANRYDAPMRSMLALPVLLALAAAPLAAQTVTEGSVLVATPGLKDPNFAESVVLVLGRDDDATLGVVVNRMTSLAPGRVFPELSAALDGYEGTLYRGGPVAPTRVLFLITGLAAAVINTPEIVDDLYVSGDPDLLPDLARLAENTSGLRLFAGHAVWQAGQLEQEISAGSWRVIPGTVDLVFSDPPSMWEQAAALSGEVVAGARRR